MMEEEDEVEDDNGNDTMQQPLVEMSQDCIIEWNESQTVDLRDIAKSPYVTTPSTAGSNHRSGPSSLGLEEVRRTLAHSSTTYNDNDTSPASLQTQPTSTYKAKKSPSQHHHGQQQQQQQQHEEEIDAIYNILQQPDDDQHPHSSHTAPTQRLGNAKKNRKLNSAIKNSGELRAPPPRLPRSSTTSLASRIRRRRRQANGHDNDHHKSNKRPHLLVKTKPTTASAHPSSFSSPIPSSSSKQASTSSTTSNNDDDSEGAFASLLKQMATPQSEERRQPMQPIPAQTTNHYNNDTTRTALDEQPKQRPVVPLAGQAVTVAAATGNSFQYQSNSAPTVSKPMVAATGIHQTKNRPAAVALPTNHRMTSCPPLQHLPAPPPLQKGSTHRTATDYHHNQTSTVTTATEAMGLPVSSHPPHRQPPQLRGQTITPPTTSSTVASSSSSIRPTVPTIPHRMAPQPNPVTAQENTRNDIGVTMPPNKRQAAPVSKPIAAQQPPHKVLSNSLLPQSHTAARPRDMPPQPANPVAKATTTITTQFDDIEDEFGDFEFSADDMVNLDSLLSVQSSQQVPPLPPKQQKQHARPQYPPTRQPSAFVATNQKALPPKSQNPPQSVVARPIVPPANHHSQTHAVQPANPNQTLRRPMPHTSNEGTRVNNAPGNLAAPVHNSGPPRKGPTQQHAKSMSVAPASIMHPQSQQSAWNSPTIAKPQQSVQSQPVVPIPIQQQQQLPSSKPLAARFSEPDDEFGDFPDFDFDLIDQAIAQRQTQIVQAANPEPSALQNDIVKNPRTDDAVDDSGLSFMKFSRYKVLNIFEDAQKYTKTLSVAVWVDAMLSDEQDEKKIHRNVQVTNVEDQQGHHATSIPRNVNYAESGLVQLRGEWYHTKVSPGDVIHLCSLTGSYRTDPGALPLILHSFPPPGSDPDDLVLVIHPDMLMTPTTVSETVSCSRRAVLKSRVGSTGLTSKAALFGTMRHDLFGDCIKGRNFEDSHVQRKVEQIVRENAEALLGCGVTAPEAEREVFSVLPVIKLFAARYTTFAQNPPKASVSPHNVVEGHHGVQNDIRFVSNSVHSIEEPIISPELALKGNVDAVLETTTLSVNDENGRPTTGSLAPQHSLMSLELKTGHNQNPQHTHMAQLSLYTLMLQGRYGTQLKQPSNQINSHEKPDPEGGATGGVLLYLNSEGSRVVHVSPAFNEIKSLVGGRNVVAAELALAARPRGIALSYDDEKEEKDSDSRKIKLLPAPPAELPEVKANSHPCKWCYANRECMLYAAAEEHQVPQWTVRHSHYDLLTQFTGQLKEEDLHFFRKWDRLIDLEADAMTRSIATAWLIDSHRREKENGESVSSLVFENGSPGSGGSNVFLNFRRSASSTTQSPLENLSLSKGCRVAVSTDGSSFDDSQSDPKMEYESTQRTRKKLRHRMHVVRGIVQQVYGDQLVLSARREDLDRLRDMTTKFRKLSEDPGCSQLLFRVDKENTSVGIGTLRQNLINFLTADFVRKEGQELSQSDIAKQRRLSRLRDFVVRLTPPSFDEKIAATFFHASGPRIPGCDLQALSLEFNELNSDQQKAVGKVMNARDYTLIQGLPGTGKTSTLAFLARLLAARGKRVLITSYTHAAVDNVMLKLIEKGLGGSDETTGLPKLVRVGQKSSSHQDVHPLLISTLAAHLESSMNAGNPNLSQTDELHRQENPSALSLKKVVSSAQIVCVSALSVPRSPLLMHEIFDVVIIDEAGQISQPAILGALMAADSFVLVGDHKQLPPLVNSEIAESGGYGESMLMRLAEKYPRSVAMLTYQYRMNEAICKVSSEAVYGGRLKCGNDEVRSKTLDLPRFPSSLPSAASKFLYSWLRAVVDPHKPVMFVDTDNIKKIPRPASERRQQGSLPVEIEALEEKMGGRVGGSITNPTEATLVRFILKGLLLSGLPASSVGIISPFRAQLRILEENASISAWKKEGLELSTIDRYQGRDKPVIILSLVRSNPGGKAGRLLQDMRRLNVAFTRAKCKLIVVGSFSTLKSGSDPLRPILSRMEKREQRFLLPETAVECYNIA